MDTPDSSIRRYGAAAIAEAAALIARGGIVAIPTETVYGLAADATDAAAVARIYAAKHRPSFNPLIVHVTDLAAAERIAVFDDTARVLAKAFWPGPLTLVLPLRAESAIAPLVTAGLDTIAIRVPAHRAMQALLAACSVPLAAPSANASGAISPTRAAHVAASLGESVPLIIDDGACETGVESTIVAGLAILRPGPVTTELIDAQFPGEGRSQVSASSAPVARPSPINIVSPGQLDSHYAPEKPMRLEADNAAENEWLIGFGAITGDDTLSASGDLTEAAARLFAALHHADATAKPRIAIAPIPTTGIGAAINDRLRRAAHR